MAQRLFLISLVLVMFRIALQYHATAFCMHSVHAVSKCHAYALKIKYTCTRLYQIILCAILYSVLINEQMLRHIYTKLFQNSFNYWHEKPLRSCDDNRTLFFFSKMCASIHFLTNMYPYTDYFKQ